MAVGRTRIVLWVTAVALTSIFATRSQAITMAFEDNKLSFKDCDGAPLTARWRDDNIRLSSGSKAIGDPVPTFKAVDWNGKCQTIGWDKDRASFIIDGKQADKRALLLRYVAPDGSKWVGLRDGDGFYVARIAGQDEDSSGKQLKKISEWLSAKSDRFSVGAEMAESLKLVAAE